MNIMVPMKEVVFLSGKGGTGKTSIVASVASLAKDKVMVDCEVEAADLHLISKPLTQEKHQYWGREVAFIDQNKCFQCGLCLTLCQFEAIEGFYIDPVSCTDCGLCLKLCPFKAISMRENLAGHWFISETRYGQLVHARLGVAQENDGELVALVREKAKAIAENIGFKLIISNGPVGAGIPIVSAISGVDLAVIVTEPTPQGINSLEGVFGLCCQSGVKPIVCINKYDLNGDNTSQIENCSKSRGIRIIARIPYDSVVTEAIIQGLPDEVSKEIVNLWQAVLDTLA